MNCLRVKIALLIFLVPSCATATDCSGGHHGESKKASLQRTADSVLRAIKQRDSSTLTNYFDPRGVGFGVDQAPLPLKEIQKQFRMKQGVYCLFFSTSCVTSTASVPNLRIDPVLSKWTISYAEWLSLSEPNLPEVEFSESNGTEMCGALVTVRGRLQLKAAPMVIELQFVYEKGRWVLTNTPYSLGE